MRISAGRAAVGHGEGDVFPIRGGMPVIDAAANEAINSEIFCFGGPPSE